MLEHELVREITRMQRQLDRLAKPEKPRIGGVAVYNSSNISIGTGAWTDLTFNSERWDDAAFHSVAINTSRLTVPTGYGGRYVIAGHAYFAASSAGTTRQIAIYLNNTTYIAMLRVPESAGFDSHMSIATVYDLDAADYVELRVYQDSGGALNIVYYAQTSPEFRMERVG